MIKKYLQIERKFDAAHKLEGYKGPCARLHGHTWKVVARFAYGRVGKVGIAADFKELKVLVDKILPDHQYINDWIKACGCKPIVMYQTMNPTAEVLSVLFYNMLKVRSTNKIRIVRVEVWESEAACAIYEEEREVFPGWK